MPRSTKSPGPRKPANKFPLSQHKRGQWRKYINGREHYFGTDKDEALAEYVRTKDDLEAGRTPSTNRGQGCTVEYLCNHWLEHKDEQRQIGELSNRCYDDYLAAARLIARHLGLQAEVDQLTPDDLIGLRRKIARGQRNQPLAPVTLGNRIQCMRVCFNHAYEAGLIDSPIRFGEFKKPGKSVVRKQRAKQSPRHLAAPVIRDLLAELDNDARATSRPEIAAGKIQVKAMVLLGINCGLGNADCGQLEVRNLDLAGRWIDYPRPKTGIERRCPLWNETVDALQAALEARKDANDKLVFRTKYGAKWFTDAARCPLSHQFRKLLQTTGHYLPGVGFYALRHTFQTVGDGARDLVATRHIMGHADSTMGGLYREYIDDDRLIDVAKHVHAWLYASGDDRRRGGV